ncbi:hypothetical protein A3E39_04475 [Candidatus Uhrbacteria bacterium RIFCSPHIGHO2_12_FULL_60_25]|uniref:Uncharacterized protein n=1 Tax=Candidatus Uhrbacteria bacterium RIFCSPHIGHO2_12_FULL_60_25 TaxID=1802399 RepID=A0A1F7UIQ4_9BACT|nr:MAG: hypothetical protein A3D73_01025 [Candidatus Uhrbacteria bacterium RIFCSPHIGHO2_02_FULL_60_44]OGL78142.1 MAG: hypothetical protein A3E39_04475 [Candidatus Uhrbacteria bacterium RIFCSPHIGHO2_12_FULL_60_25]
MPYTPIQDETTRLIVDLRRFSQATIKRSDQRAIHLLHNTVTLAYILVAAVIPREQRTKYAGTIISNVERLREWARTSSPAVPFPRALLILGNGMTPDEQFKNIASRMSELFDELFGALTAASKVEPSPRPTPSAA